MGCVRGRCKIGANARAYVRAREPVFESTITRPSCRIDDISICRFDDRSFHSRASADVVIMDGSARERDERIARTHGSPYAKFDFFFQISFLLFSVSGKRNALAEYTVKAIQAEADFREYYTRTNITFFSIKIDT